LPNHGKLKYFKEPKDENGVRIETGVRENDSISTFYDPMIAKLITYAPTREQAIDKMKTALQDYKVVGLKNNLKFLKRVFENDIFRGGEYDTSFIEKNVDTLIKKDKVSNFDKIAAVVCRNHNKCKEIALPAELLNFRNVKGKKEHFTISIDETSFEKVSHENITLEFGARNQGVVHCEGKKHDFSYTQIS
jgi:acetyl/propionyl-CoA carboxylase alpha subunit